MGTAFFAGLRRGELLGLRWEDVDLSGSRIRVERAYHPETDSYGPPKSKAGKRMVGLPRILIPYLAALDNTEGLVFPDPRGGPMEYHRLQRRAVAAWKRAGLDPIGLHECRHTYASVMIQAGVNIKTLQSFMGHSSVTITLDRYGHLLPGSEQVAMGLLDDFLERELAA